MTAYSYNNINKQFLSTDIFEKLSTLIQTNLGIRMPEEKKTMLESRLQKRLRALNLDSYHKYCRYLFSDSGIREELPHFFDMITTNKTDFFREASHFDFLKDTVIPNLLSEKQTSHIINIWSAGCATGEEPYTIAIVLSELKAAIANWAFNIIASDISNTSLEKAKLAVYQDNQIQMIPECIKKKYFLRSKDHDRQLVRIVPGLRSSIDFKRINLMDEKFPIQRKVDIIFCRNVLIYFDRCTQEKLIRKFIQYLKPGGYLFLGHAETLCNMSIPMFTVAPNVYRLS